MAYLLYNDKHVVAGFTKKEDAEKYKKELENIGSFHLYLKEFELDPKVSKILLDIDKLYYVTYNKKEQYLRAYKTYKTAGFLSHYLQNNFTLDECENYITMIIEADNHKEAVSKFYSYLENGGI